MKLVVPSPGYSQMETVEKDAIKVLGSLGRDEYFLVLKNSRFVVAPPFGETFGCVFAEAEHLGIPVIYFAESGAVGEICSPEYFAGSIWEEGVTGTLSRILCSEPKRPEPRLDLSPKKAVEKWLEIFRSHT
jgi:glycosyltransferase involved in cell wall biosynthesis